MSNIIELKGIKQVYTSKDEGEFTLFEDLDFVIEDIPDKGQFAVIMGKSGCGKSTLLRYITGLQQPTAGEILIEGVPLTPQHTIPMVFQMPSSLEWYSVLDNVALPLTIKGVNKSEAKDRAMEMIKVVGLEGHETKYAKYPLLSGGQLQRVAIARSLVANPKMIMMDEPFSALDASNRRKMQVLLMELFRSSELADLNPTVLLVTHSESEAAFLANDIFIMGEAPNYIRHHIKVDFSVRNLDTRKTAKFLELVAYIEGLNEAR